MTQAIEDTLNLPPIKDVTDQTLAGLKTSTNINDHESNQEKLSELQDTATTIHSDLMDAGFNIESKHASNFLEPAMQALNSALDAEKTKIDQKIKLQKLQIEFKKLELAERKMTLAERNAGGIEATIIPEDDDSFITTRSQILAMAAEDYDDA